MDNNYMGKAAKKGEGKFVASMVKNNG